jgi:hypothetical protein
MRALLTGAEQPARLTGKMSHAIFGNVRLKRAGTPSIPLPKVSLNLAGESPGPIGPGPTGPYPLHRTGY